MAAPTPGTTPAPVPNSELAPAMTPEFRRGNSPAKDTLTATREVLSPIPENNGGGKPLPPSSSDGGDSIVSSAKGGGSILKSTEVISKGVFGSIRRQRELTAIGRNDRRGGGSADHVENIRGEFSSMMIQNRVVGWTRRTNRGSFRLPYPKGTFDLVFARGEAENFTPAGIATVFDDTTRLGEIRGWAAYEIGSILSLRIIYRGGL